MVISVDTDAQGSAGQGGVGGGGSGGRSSVGGGCREGEGGGKQAAKKRTTVMTNSANLAEVLRQAQCKGLRKH